MVEQDTWALFIALLGLWRAKQQEQDQQLQALEQIVRTNKAIIRDMNTRIKELEKARSLQGV